MYPVHPSLRQINHLPSFIRQVSPPQFFPVHGACAPYGSSFSYLYIVQHPKGNGHRSRGGRASSQFYGSSIDSMSMVDGVPMDRESIDSRYPPYHAFREEVTYNIDVLAALADNDESRYIQYATSADSTLALLESRKYKGNTFAGSNLSMNNASTSQISKNSLTGFGEDANYPSWGPADNIPMTLSGIEAIFTDIAKKFGFQNDNVQNMLDHLMVMLDSRSSRMKPQQALDTLHADYIGGELANYRQWYFAAQIDVLDNEEKDPLNEDDLDEAQQLAKAAERWKLKMRALTNEEKVRDLALYLLIWGEAAAVRFTPEALCFFYKVASDYYCHGDCPDVPEGTFLDDIVIPLYRFFRDQTYEKINGRLVKREKDHDKIIGYDDVNQFFWQPTCFRAIKLSDKRTLHGLAPHERFPALKGVDWNHTFFKTYKEKRTWMHASINFTRVWIIHIVSFYYYISSNATTLYLSADPEIAQTESAVQWSIVALGGVIAVMLMLIGSFSELSYLPISWSSTRVITRRIMLLCVLLVLNAGPTVYCVFIDRRSPISRLVAASQLLISIATTLYLAITPSSKLFVRSKRSARSDLVLQKFTANFPPLKRIDRIMSIALWVFVFTCKLLESYFFLALSFKDPLKVMHAMHIEHCNDKIIGSALCSRMPNITIVLMFLMDLVLYFLDTYLWYIIWNTVFSVARSFYLGISIWTPWRNIFSRLPTRIFVKLLATSDIQIKLKTKVVCSQIWNAIVITMYREHLITVDHAQRMLYEQEINPVDGRKTLKPPTFFVSQEDTAFKTEYFPQHSEAERRIHFFAQSLTTPMPPPRPIGCMPSFTVLTPHYGEKILLTLREIIREEDQYTRITLLEYLKQLHPIEWDNFVRDTKIMAEEAACSGNATRSSSLFSEMSEKDTVKSKIDDLPFYCIGFKSSKPEYTLRTRIWASLRSQTLYRTVSGFMNYRKAIKLLYRVEHPDIISSYHDDVSRLDRDLDRLARRKFKFLVAMQRYAKFNQQEAEDAELLFKAYPDLQVAYIEEVEPREDEPDGEVTYYSALIDGHCERLENGKRKPKYRVRLPGNPILGDGKSDNQNHALIFYRGEFLQLIDANQDNYLEECLKIRNVLGEFECLEPSEVSPYSPAWQDKQTAPVAIVGAREYIFSENIGVLGDVAAGKEQTFGTLTQRIMAKVGGKLHYGHPDFLNAIFMTTRGGVSKAQKGLHLNEDIYAGMNAFTRGGRIKHTEYFQCGKGRDLGFGSILNFTTKIGTGMGEQMLSREYYYIGTQLPLDRFLTFYYAHPGFHINNIFIMFSVQMFMYALMFIGAMGSTLLICEYNADAPPDAPLTPDGCYNMVPIFEWVKRCILSIFIVFFVSFLPLFLQELTERGFWRSLTRLGRHFMSFSPLFEIFVTQIYTNSVLDNMVYGGAQYIATGRGFATSRIPFALLYSRFSGSSIYSGSRNLLIMLFASLAVWLPHLIYFWFTVVALIVSPFIFNPNQFSLVDFLVDYREFMRWLSRGNSKTHQSSWINHCRLSRTRITGYKRRRTSKNSTVVGDIPRARIGAIFFSEVVLPFIVAILCVVPYLFVRSFDPDDSTLASKGPSALLRVGAIAMGPILLNAGALAMLFFLSIVLGSSLSLCCTKFGSTVAAMAHGWAVINLIIFVEALMLLEEWKLTNIILGLVCMIGVQRFVLKSLTVLFLTREFKHDEANRGWWTGKWYGRGVSTVSQPLREYLCKIVEMSIFAIDFVLGHFILFFLSIFCLIPYINTAHSLMLFWLRPSKQIRPPVWTAKQRRARRKIAITYGLLFFALFFLFVALIGGPMVVGKKLKFINPRKLPI
ncbi:1,3-beta-glucan synthase component-domain-containing protein [Radiomyces spectabilis]|uniref:1,3-beta-glucan synthase component-domain-containing protein n=1 Tax=Radiomyces spectabilis TaxID=64574 RepID=UPI00221EB0E9|nr:1,3-beta-glucan synthase component-domain-containing protein [Radiomyces spectabilis]KAI8384484.1 1,3-beta-glucan synthase component-domain-containing protein [Radiomyces spectabilis]